MIEQKAMSVHLGQEGGHKACQLPGPGEKHACRMPLGWGWLAVSDGETGSTEAGSGNQEKDICAS